MKLRFTALRRRIQTKISPMPSGPASARASAEPRHYAFIHIPRTGGSTIWHALALLSKDVEIPIVDLYHDAKRKFNNSSKTVEALVDIQKFLRANTCLIHHHVASKIDSFFDRKLQYATVVRDPIDRFLSEINHVKHFVQTGMDNNIDIGWDESLLKLACSPSVPIETLVHQAKSSPYFQDYYRRWFGAILLGRDGNDCTTSIQDIWDPRFPTYVRQAFSYIGNFQHLERVLLDISRSFGLPEPSIAIGHINKAKQSFSTAFNRNEYVAYFERDYAFLQDIGLYYRN